MSERLAPGVVFAGYERAYEARDVATWRACYTDDAEWIEYRHLSPARPNWMVGTQAIGAFLHAVEQADLMLAMSDEVVSPERAAFPATTTFSDGRRLIEYVIVQFVHGRRVRQVDVEAPD